MHTTNYENTFIWVAEDCPVTEAETPLPRGGKPTIASLQFELITARPYELTSDDVLFEVYAKRQRLSESDRDEARVQFFAKPQACLRASPLGKRYGWGIHSDADGHVAIYAIGTDEYEVFAADDSTTQLRAMRSKRAR